MPERPTCPYCAATVSTEARYCDKCGTPLTHDLPTPSRRRGQPGGRLSIWLFLTVLVAVFATGTFGGFRYRAGYWPIFGGANPAVASGQVTIPTSPTDDVLAANYRRAVVSIDVRGDKGNRAGSGFLIDNKGHVVTAAHVVEGARGCITVVDDDGRAHPATPVPLSTNLDIAMLYVPDMANWPDYLEFGSSAQLNVDDEVYVLGSPKGVGNVLQQKAAVNRLGVNKSIDSRYLPNLIEISGATVIEGTSGAPLLHKATKRVVGIINSSGGAAPVAWAVPADDARPELQQGLAATPALSCRPDQMTNTVPVTLATITPRTAAYGLEGNDLADGVQLAIRDMETLLRSVGYEVTLKRLDDEGSPARAMERAAEATFDPQVIGVVGSLDNQSTYALAEALKVSGMPLVAPTAGAEELTARSWPHVHRIVANQIRQEQVMAVFASQQLKAKSVLVVEDGSPEAARQSPAFKANAQIVGLTVADTVTVAGDPAGLNEKVATSGVDAIYLAGRPENALRLARALRQEGVALPILGGQAIDQRFQTFTGAGAEGIYFASLTALPGEPFRKHFENVLGKPTRGYAVYGYDAAGVILAALVRYGEKNPGQVPPPAELSKLVRETKGHLGWSARISFDPSGENITSWVHVYQWKQGVAELLANFQ